MKRTVWIASCLALIVFMAQPAGAANSVLVDSKTFTKNQAACTVGVWLTNDVFLTAYTCPLEMRESSPAAYLLAAPFVRDFRVNARVRVSGLQDSRILRTLGTPAAQTCSGPVSNTYSATAALNGSPDGLMFACFNQTNPNLNPGSDLVDSWVHLDVDGDGIVDDSSLVPRNPSIILVFTTDNRDGFFEVDTCCVTPMTHLRGVEAGTNLEVSLSFTKGLIQVCSPTGQQPVALCRDVVVSAGANCGANASVDNGSFDPEGGPVTLLQEPSGPYPRGQTGVLLIVRDVDCNESTCQATVTVADDIRPSAICPSDTTAGDQPGLPGAFVTYNATATDNCPGAQVSCVPPSGSFFLLGVTIVRCIATDAAGNRDTCTFVVTVLHQNLPPVAYDDWAASPQGGPVVIDVLANDTDSDGTLNPASVVFLSSPINGALSLDPSTGKVTYTPNASFAGSDFFSYTVKDDDGTVSNAARVTVMIAPAACNDRPVDFNCDSIMNVIDIVLGIDVVFRSASAPPPCCVSP